MISPYQYIGGVPMAVNTMCHAIAIRSSPSEFTSERHPLAYVSTCEDENTGDSVFCSNPKIEKPKPQLTPVKREGRWRGREAEDGRAHV